MTPKKNPWRVTSGKWYQKVTDDTWQMLMMMMMIMMIMIMMMVIMMMSNRKKSIKAETKTIQLKVQRKGVRLFCYRGGGGATESLFIKSISHKSSHILDLTQQWDRGSATGPTNLESHWSEMVLVAHPITFLDTKETLKGVITETAPRPIQYIGLNVAMWMFFRF